MFSRLTNSPETFQTIMNSIFQELIDERVVVIYMDHILIFGSCKGLFYLESYVLRQDPVGWAELISSDWSRQLIPIPIT